MDSTQTREPKQPPVGEVRAPASLPVPAEPVRREPDPPAPSQPRWGWLPVLTTRATLERGRAAEGRSLLWACMAGAAWADAALEREGAEELAVEVTALAMGRGALEDVLDRVRAERRAEAEDARAREEGLEADLRGMEEQLAAQRAEIDRLRKERDAARHAAGEARRERNDAVGNGAEALAALSDAAVLLHYGRPVGVYPSMAAARVAADQADGATSSTWSDAPAPASRGRRWSVWPAPLWVEWHSPGPAALGALVALLLQQAESRLADRRGLGEGRRQLERVAEELEKLAGRQELVVLLHHGRPVGIYTSLGDARADVTDLERWVREWEDRDGGEATEAVDYMGEMIWEARALSRWWAQHGTPEIWTLLIRLRCAQLDGVRLEERQTWEQ